MSELAARRAEETLRLIRAAVRYRDGHVILVDVLRNDAKTLQRAGFSPHPIRLEHDDGSAVESDLWTQDTPQLADYLHAAFLLFGDEPGSLSWDAGHAEH
jgi:hypothetical protein